MKKLGLRNIHYIATLKAFEQRKEDEGKSVSHIMSVTNLSKEFLHYLETQNIHNLQTVNQTTINQYFQYLEYRNNERRQGGLSTSYLKKHQEAVLRFMEYIKNKEIGKSGFTITKYPKQEIPKDILTREEVKELFTNTENNMNGIRNKVILSLLYGMGLRKGELHRLNVQDINMAKHQIRIQKSKTGRQRDIPMTKQIQIYLEQYLYDVRQYLIKETETQESAFLLNNQGERMSLSGIAHKVKQIAQKTDIQKPITAHRLRHAIGTHLMDNFSLEEIALFLGHRSIDSTQIYTHTKYTKAPQQ
jgi:integrase/recombinase XerD